MIDRRDVIRMKILVLVELEKDGYSRIALDEDELRKINHLIN